MKTILKSSLILALAVWVALFGVVCASSALAQYVEADLTGFTKSQRTRFIDPNLNGWGMVQMPNGDFCVANTATGVATFYDPSGKPTKLVITVPAGANARFGPVGSPTGVVYNSTRDFVISAHGKSAPARLIFDTLDGTISGWNPRVDPTHAIIMVDNSAETPLPGDYTALSLGQDSHGRNVLYACDSGDSATLSNNRVDMFDGQFHSLGSFTDPAVAPQYPGNTVFQAKFFEGRVFVMFATFTAPFDGIIDIFDRDGNLLTPHHWAVSGFGTGPLVNPWAIARAPRNFGRFSHAILIGNVEDGRISAYSDLGRFLGQLKDLRHHPIAIAGLWELVFARQCHESRSNQLYFAAGPDAEDFAGNGLFGFIVPATDDDN